MTATIPESLVTQAWTLGSDLGVERQHVVDLLMLATDLSLDRRRRREHPRLDGARIALISGGRSAHLQACVELAVHDQGGRLTSLDDGVLRFGRDEPVEDTARTLGGVFDGIMLDGHSQQVVDSFAAHARVPVWNLRSDTWQPVQALADMLTMAQHCDGSLEDIAVCYAGDGHHPAARSLLVTGAQLGMDLRLASPRHHRPPGEALAAAHQAARYSNARLTITDDLDEAVPGADFLYTAPWIDAADPGHTWIPKVQSMIPYRITRQLMAATNRFDAHFMHPLPAVHNRHSQIGSRLYKQFGLDGAEVTDQVFHSPQSLVLPQATNRLHAIKALLITGLAR